MARMHNPPHPGPLIKSIIDEKRMTVSAFAEHIGMSRVALSRVLNERASVTAMLDYIISTALGQTPGLWLRMQTSHDLWQLEQQPLPRIERLAA